MSSRWRAPGGGAILSRVSSTRSPLPALSKLQAGLFGLYYLWTLYGFTRLAGRHGDAFTDVVYDRYLGTLVWHHLRVIPAYVVVGVVATALIWPWVHRWRPLVEWARGERRGRRAIKPVAGVAGLDLLLYAVSLGPFFSRSPGLVDGMARKASGWVPFDHYDLFRYHILDGMSVLFGLVVLRALWFYARRLWVHRWGRLALAGAALAGAVGVWRSAQPPVRAPAVDGPPNVLIIAADSLRADRVGALDASAARRDPPITPHIDAFAREAVSLDAMHVATASTLESWYTAFSGRWPPSHGVRYMYLRRAAAEQAGAAPGLLPRLFAEAGYHTAVVSDWAGNCFRLVDMGFETNRASPPQTFRALMLDTVVWSHVFFPLYFANDFGEWLLPEVATITRYVRPDALTARMLGEIDAAVEARRPFFGLVFYSTPHLPYSASYPFNLSYVDPGYAGPHRYEIEVGVSDLIHDGFAHDLPDATVDHIRALYDGAVREFDHHVGRLLAGLEARGLSDRTIVVITSDHGEDLYEPGSTLGHGTNFFGGDQSTRIPFLVRAPGLQARGGARVDAITRNVDIAPTLARLAGMARHDGWGGVDLMPVLDGSTDDLDLPAFAETCYLFFPKDRIAGLSASERSDLLTVAGAVDTLEVDPAFDDNLVLRADLHAGVIETKDTMVRTRRWKLIEIPGRGGPIRRLYDMAADPGQRRDLSGRGLAIEARLAAALARYRAGEAAGVRWSKAREAAGAIEYNGGPSGRRTR